MSLGSPSVSTTNRISICLAVFVGPRHVTNTTQQDRLLQQAVSRALIDRLRLAKTDPSVLFGVETLGDLRRIVSDRGPDLHTERSKRNSMRPLSVYFGDLLTRHWQYLDGHCWQWQCRSCAVTITVAVARFGSVRPWLFQPPSCKLLSNLRRYVGGLAIYSVIGRQRFGRVRRGTTNTDWRSSFSSSLRRHLIVTPQVGFVCCRGGDSRIKTTIDDAGGIMSQVELGCTFLRVTADSRKPNVNGYTFS